MSLLLLGKTKVVAGGAPPSEVTPFFADNFAGGQLNSANGFSWIRESGSPWGVSSDRGVNGGTNSIKITYGPDPLEANGLQGSADITFDFREFGAVSELWVEWYLFVPENYVHRNNATPNLTENNKLFAIFRDEVNETEAWRAFITTFRVNDSTTEVRGDASTRTSFVTAAVAAGITTAMGPGRTIDTGVWTRMRLHLKAASSSSSTDGAFELWANTTKLVNVTNGAFWNHESTSTYADTKLNYGYFMGASNSGFTEATSFYIGDTRFYNQNPGW